MRLILSLVGAIAVAAAVATVSTSPAAAYPWHPWQPWNGATTSSPAPRWHTGNEAVQWNGPGGPCGSGSVGQYDDCNALALEPGHTLHPAARPSFDSFVYSCLPARIPQ